MVAAILTPAAMATTIIARPAIVIVAAVRTGPIIARIAILMALMVSASALALRHRRCGRNSHCGDQQT
jgi:uncharacterized membrane protein affecting hemolysin expression